jgi:acetolactate synthase I/III small subunit
MTAQLKERTISVTVNNRPDVLARIAGTFSARGFNIESISANVTRNPAVTKIIITTLTSSETIARVIKQLDRLVDVLEVRRLRRPDSVHREMLLARLPVTGERRVPIEELVKSCGGKVLNEESGSLIVEFTGDTGEIEATLACLDSLGMEELARTGLIAVAKKRP